MIAVVDNVARMIAAVSILVSAGVFIIEWRAWRNER